MCGRRISGRPGHPVVFERAVFDELRALGGDEGARGVIAAHRQKLIECSDVADDGDIDTTAALALANALRRDR